MYEHGIQRDSGAWKIFIRACFMLAIGATSGGIYFLPVDYWAKGYLGMGMLFLMASSFMLSKNIRDDFESKKIINQIQEVKTEKMLKEYEEK